MKRRTLRNVLLLSTLFLITSCNKFHWKAKPWAADHETQGIYRGDEFIGCEDPRFDEFIPFHYTNIAELKAAIDRVKKKKKVKKALRKALKNLPKEDQFDPDDPLQLDQIQLPSPQSDAQ